MQKTRIVTHSGNFHADDVFAVATVALSLGEKPYEVVRTRDLDVINTGDYIVDVGGVHDPKKNMFDHHQIGGAGERVGGIPYSSFGLVWKEFGESFCGSSTAADRIDTNLVAFIDATDNGIDTHTTKNNVRPYFFHDVIESSVPTWKEIEKGKTTDSVFIDLVDTAKHVLEREIVVAKDFEEGFVFVDDICRKAKNRNIIVIDGHYPWEEVLVNYPNVLFVVKPDKSNENEWKVRAIREDLINSFKSRKELPESWAGKKGKDLAEVTGVPDAKFCHNKRFIAIAGSKKGAIKLAELALEV